MPGHNHNREHDVHTAYSGRWLHFRIASYQDEDGRRRQWEYVDREGLAAAALMVVNLQPAGDLVLVRQRRAAMGGDTVEFPAGLVDAGETVEQAALRELREETGLEGQVVRVSPVLATSPGLTSERAYLVELEAAEAGPDARSPRPQPAPGERIEVLRVPMDEALDRLAALAREGVVIDSRVWAWAAAARLGRTRHPAPPQREQGGSA